jgi:hypothetical protein
VTYVRKSDVRIYLVSDVNSAAIQQADVRFMGPHVTADGRVSWNGMANSRICGFKRSKRVY